MKRLTSILKDVGFSSKDIRVYLATLELGEAMIADIARRADVSRTTCYKILEELVEKHLISFYVKRKKRYFLAEDPQKLIDLLKQHTETLEEALPSLRAAHRKWSFKPDVRLYTGIKGLNSILLEVLAEQRNFEVIASVDDDFQLHGEDVSEYIEQRKKLHLRVRLLTDKSKKAQEFKMRDSEELRETRFVPSQYDFKTANYIFGNKVALISLRQEHPMGLVINDEALADTFRMYFDLLWKSASRN